MTSRTLEAFLYIAQMLMSVLEPTSRHPLGGTLEMKSHKLSGDCPKRREINIHTLKTGSMPIPTIRSLGGEDTIPGHCKTIRPLFVTVAMVKTILSILVLAIRCHEFQVQNRVYRVFTSRAVSLHTVSMHNSSPNLLKCQYYTKMYALYEKAFLFQISTRS